MLKQRIAQNIVNSKGVIVCGVLAVMYVYFTTDTIHRAWNLMKSKPKSNIKFWKLGKDKGEKSKIE